MATTENSADLGPNAWLVDEMRAQWAADPASVDAEWRTEFEHDGPHATTEAAPAAEPIEVGSSEVTKATVASTDGWGSPPPATTASAAPATPPAPAAPEPTSEPSSVEPPTYTEHSEAIRGAGARIVTNMEASLDVPTATSFRQVPAKLLEINRKVINGHLARKQTGKISFTHLIGYAVVRAIADEMPAMNNTYEADADGKPRVIRNPHVGLGIAVDLEKADGSRTLMVPCVRDADTLDFRPSISWRNCPIENLANRL